MSPKNSLSKVKKKLQKAGNINENIATEDIVEWSDMMNVSLAKGPKKEKVKFDFGWKSSLVVLYEIFLAHKKISSTDHHSKRKSSADFISPNPKSKRSKPLEVLRRETIKNKEKSCSFSSRDDSRCRTQLHPHLYSSKNEHLKRVTMSKGIVQY